MRISVASFLAIALVAGLFVAGCGSDSDGSDDSATITKVTFVKKANGICKATVGKILAEATPIVRKAAKQPNYDLIATEIKLVPTIIVPGLQNEVDEVRALGIPSGDEAQVNAILAEIQTVIKKFETDPEGLSKDPDHYAKAEALADKYGLTECPYL